MNFQEVSLLKPLIYDIIHTEIQVCVCVCVSGRSETCCHLHLKTLHRKYLRTLLRLKYIPWEVLKDTPETPQEVAKDTHETCQEVLVFEVL